MHAALKTDLESLTKHVQELENKLESASSVDAPTTLESGFSGIINKIDNLENQSRRSNVLYGVTDTTNPKAEKVQSDLSMNSSVMSLVSL